MAIRTRTDLIVVHCSATKPSQDIGAREIDAMHRGFGWAGGIGYHAVIRRNGNVELGRPWDDVGAHAKGFNHRSIGVCLIGGLNGAGDPAPIYEPEQIETLKLLLDGLRTRYRSAPVIGHRDLSPDLDGSGTIEPAEFVKMCPSFDVSEWIQSGELRLI